MSNEVTIQATQFVNMRGAEKTGSTFGFRIYDDYDSVYSNLMMEGEFLDISSEDLAFLKYVVDNASDKIEYMLDSVVENEKGMEINGTWYDWNEIKDILC